MNKAGGGQWRCFVLSEISFSGGFYRNRWHLGRRAAEFQSHLHSTAPASDGHWRRLGRVGRFPQETGQVCVSAAVILFSSICSVPTAPFHLVPTQLLLSGRADGRNSQLCSSFPPRNTLKKLWLLKNLNIFRSRETT